MTPKPNLFRRATLVLAIVLFLVVPLNVNATPPPPQAGPSFETRVEAWLSQTGYNYRKVKSNSWYIILTGRQLTQIRILVGAGPSSIAVGAVVVPKRSLRVTADSLYKMMKLSYDLNYVRVCIDPDDDLLVMAQVEEKSLNAEEFKKTVDRVAAAADRAYGEVQPFVIAPD